MIIHLYDILAIRVALLVCLNVNDAVVNSSYPHNSTSILMC
ncbi:hypothetical protein ECHHL_0015 [Ehrlichia chaffeensis str. Heartland]|uniref:Uncharacterized protein n=1 Tax=Ehrlichia chaffeensis (strain ATCC CRL-10679 / Arkansas) TaxID=205920 RepID=Q2GI81_EHRCR|nr:hypothetical protein ECH_0017 [Ehrlichia chaffeensis str. Arkansas]AHX03192.1 hypothetical protein ECHHL_0015 [Ehrlichia chaffeensis str. Heartland]AHX05108.1 hypothetical protein ECHJAX_0015 [Ehrlichia chaffeensis str. Jax]AHX06097.1 hypothetical protein ECHLIB_0015 [Ehrlichia chaffeensis str. Liberty]AHX07881.1 hypothetical protein ECHOSC_0015 [Ehrlichia chaffeensis str. Osceola]AHX08810.1 hypothetical protein ECHSTV_0015 [Ehrlichia chaffeensis str. Saint Vincent]AHX10398.1 hypothetical 